jgi:hypothetical protein
MAALISQFNNLAALPTNVWGRRPDLSVMLFDRLKTVLLRTL